MVFAGLRDAHAASNAGDAVDAVHPLKKCVMYAADGMRPWEIKGDPFLSKWAVFTSRYQGDMDAFRADLNLACGGDGKSRDLPPSEDVMKYVCGNLRRIETRTRRSGMNAMEF